MSISSENLKKILIEENYLDDNAFKKIQKESNSTNVSLEILLVQRGVIDDEKLGKLISKKINHPFFSLKKAHIKNITKELLYYIPEVAAEAQQAIVFEEKKDKILLATSRPDNYEFIKQLEQKAGKKVEVYYTTPFNLESALKHYRGDLTKEVSLLLDSSQKKATPSEENIVRLVGLFIEHAYLNQATDIHLTPLIDVAQVRFRIDGILYEVVEYPLNFHGRISSRIKILSRLRIDEKASSQDGRFSYSVKGGVVDIRVSIVPITEGENIVMRLLAQRGKKFTLNEVGLFGDDLKKAEMATKGSWGMIVAVGPTGSGKTTTMYAMLHVLNRPEVNIMTIEDPIEYKVEKIQQIQINPPKNITFPSGLRAIVRQDPDIILVGEIRDKETVEIAINSAMTGHLVLSTMHANDAATALVRLIEMGAKPFLVASAVNIVIAQRLVRKICSSCSVPNFFTAKEIEIISGDQELLEEIQSVFEEKDLTKIQAQRGRGCKFCEESGYTGRIGIFEIMKITEKTQKFIVGKASSKEIRRTAIEEGMTSMLHDGIVKIKKGITTLEEVIKTIRA